jgi:hypothetical protein
VLIRVQACGVCRTDLHILDGELAEPKLPLVPGHEIVGTVVATGPGVERIRKGDLAFQPIPTLTILFHPQVLRVGARAYLGQIVRGQEARLSRLEPDFI